MHDVPSPISMPVNARASALRPTRAVRCFAWDLADADAEEVMAGLRESGIDGIHLALAWHGGRFYCPHNPKHALVHAPDGVVYFQPSPQFYEGIRPRAHPEFGSGTFAARIRSLCREYEMACIGWIALFNNQSISTWFPESACVNALGDRLDGALCPANPDIRAYAQGLVHDLAHEVEVDVIELEDFAYPSLNNYAGAQWRGIEIGPGLAFLLSLCFCEHCRRRAKDANIEADDLARLVERMIRSGLAGDLSERRLNDEISDPNHPLGRHGAVRAEVITSLLDDLLDATADSGAMLQPLLTEEPDLAWRNGVELRELRRRAHRATVVAPSMPTPAVQTFLEDYEEVLQMQQDVAVDLCLSSLSRLPGQSAAPDLPAVLNAVQAAGYERLILSHYGLASLEHLEWLSAAARRS